MDQPNKEALTSFLEFQWGTEEGQVRLATMKEGGEFNDTLVEWPRMKNKIVDWMLTRSAEGKDVFYTPALFLPDNECSDRDKRDKAKGTRENVKSSQVVWVDLDGNAPDNWEVFAKEKGIPEPSLIIQSSAEGHQHVYWKLDKHTDPGRVEEINRTLAYTVGADNSGWDATQLLRPVGLLNYGYRGGDRGRKPWYNGQPLEARVIGRPSGERIDAANFGVHRDYERDISDKLRGILGNLPSLDSVKIDATWSEALKESFFLTKEEATERSPDKRSGSIQRLAYDAVESGLLDAQVYVLLDDADKRWEKYVKRSPSQRTKILLDTVARARAKTNANEAFIENLTKQVVEDSPEEPLMFSYWDFMDAEVPEVEWIFKGLMAKQSGGFLTSEPGVGKTQLSMQIARAAATGRSMLWFDNECGPLKVLVFSLEMGHTELRDILYPSTENYPRGTEQGLLLQKNLTIIPSNRIETMRLDTPNGQNLFERFIEYVKPDLVIIDSLSEIISKSISDDETAMKVSSYLARKRQERRVATMIIHHNRKVSSDRTKRGPMGLSDMYGSTYWAAKADYAFALEKTGTPGSLKMHSLKVRNAPEWGTRYLLRNEQLEFNEGSESDGIAEFIIGASNSGNSEGNFQSGFGSPS